MFVFLSLLSVGVVSSPVVEVKFDAISYSQGDKLLDYYKISMLTEMKSKVPNIIGGLVINGKISCKTSKGRYIDSILVSSDVDIEKDEIKSGLSNTFLQPGIPGKPLGCKLSLVAKNGIMKTSKGEMSGFKEYV